MPRKSLQEDCTQLRVSDTSSDESSFGTMPPRHRRNTVGTSHQPTLISNDCTLKVLPVRKIGVCTNALTVPSHLPNHSRMRSAHSTSFLTSSQPCKPSFGSQINIADILGSLPEIHKSDHSSKLSPPHTQGNVLDLSSRTSLKSILQAEDLLPLDSANHKANMTSVHMPYSYHTPRHSYPIYRKPPNHFAELNFSFDVQRITMNFIMPNGILIPLEVSTYAPLGEIKAELWEKASDLPLYGLLQEMTKYHFCTSGRCKLNPANDISGGTSGSMELLDESVSLRDVGPLLTFLRVIERKGNETEKILNKDVGSLIGKDLSDFGALKNPEVNEFRWKMKALADEEVKDRTSRSWEKRVQYIYPCSIDPCSEMPEYLLSRIDSYGENGEKVIFVLVRFSFAVRNVTPTFTVRVKPDALPSQIMELALSKFNPLDSNKICKSQFNKSNYIFKTVGKEEYLVEEVPLFRYVTIQDHLAKKSQHSLTLVVVERSTLEVDEDEYKEYGLSDSSSGVRNSFSTLTLNKKKPNTVPSCTIDEKFRVDIGSITKLNLLTQENTKISVIGCLYHGTNPLCNKESTILYSIDNDSVVVNCSLEFNICVSNLPRSARLCLGIYEEFSLPNSKQQSLQKGGKKNASLYHPDEPRSVAWVNISVFDYRRGLRKGAMTLYCWSASQEVELPKPLGTVVSNPDHDKAIAITVTFPRFHPSCDLIYPSQYKLLDIAQSEPHENITVTKEDDEMLKREASRDMLMTVYHDTDPERLWSLRWHCSKSYPHILPRLLQYVQWNNKVQVAQVTEILEHWPQLEPERALELLDYNYPENVVRDYAVDCIANFSDEDLLLYLLQLTQALKHENHLSCTLAEFLLKRALNNTKIGHFLFWHLRSEMHVPAVSIRFGLILESYCKGAQEHMKLLTRQLDALNKFRELRAISIKHKGAKTRDALQEVIRTEEMQAAFVNFRNLLEPTQQLTSVKADSCRSMDSKMAPLWLVFESEEEDISLLYKNGDDLRQDMLTLQIIRIMDKLWKSHGWDFRMNPYRCISTATLEGVIEGVRHATTIANIQRDKGILAATSSFRKGSLLEWLREKNKPECLDKAISEFTYSCAGYCVATYVLGIADRHSDNIMIMENGQLFHIDFGHILGRFKEKFGFKREHQPFVLTHDFIYVITKGSNKESEDFKKFKKYCEEAFMILRKYGTFIISLFAMMISTGLPELQNESDLDYVNERLQLGLTDSEALEHFRKQFAEALKNCWKTSLNWAFHAMNKDNR